MRFLSIDNVVPGSRLAKPLYGAQGVVLLRHNVELTEALLYRLKGLGYTGLYIEDELSEGIIIEDVVDERLRLETAYRLEELVNNNGNLIEMMPKISEIVDSIIDNKDVLININCLRGHHEYTYTHCINVGILSVGIGMKFNLKRDELLHLGTAGMLHDIGKKGVPVEILDKRGKLSSEEFDIIQKHPEFGYKMLTEALELCAVTKVGVLQHHERFDGSGYPRGLKGNEINMYGRILAVADTYDAMTSDRAYRTAVTPWEAVEYLMGAGNCLYDSSVIDQFIRCITVYPIGSVVELSDGTQGIVVKNYGDCILRPLIRNIKTKDLIDLKNDLMYLNTCIIKIIM